MSRIFNLSFDYNGRSYTALVSVAGNEDENVRITTYDDKIRLMLPAGNLVFSISDVLHRLLASRQKDPNNATVYVTENISLQLMNTNW
jgi:hypothetical protein